MDQNTSSTTPPPEQAPVQSGTAGKKSLVIAGAIVALLILGGIAYGAYKKSNNVSLPEITAKALERVQEAKSVVFDSTLTIDLSNLHDEDFEDIFRGSGLTTKTISLTSKGAFDIFDEAKPKLQTTLSFSAGQYSAEAEIRAVNEILYARVTKMPELGIGEMSEVMNKWYEFPYSGEGMAASGLPPVSEMLGGTGFDTLEALTPEQKEHIAELTKNAHFVTAQKLENETVGGAASHHFSFQLDQAGIEAYLTEVRDYIHTVGKNDSRLSSFDPVDGYRESMESIKNLRGEAWIGRADGLPHKFIIEFDVTDGSEDSVGIKLVGVFSDWNKPVSVTAPLDVTPFMSLIEQSLGEAREKADAAKSMSMISSARGAAELYWYDNGSSYKGFCNSEYALEIKEAVEGFTCKDAVNSWAASAHVESASGSHFCADNTGITISLKKAPTGTTCK